MLPLAKRMFTMLLFGQITNIFFFRAWSTHPWKAEKIHTVFQCGGPVSACVWVCNNHLTFWRT